MDAKLQERLGKLLPMLSSDKPGEVAAAAAAIGRALNGAGRDWHDLASMLNGQGSNGRDDGWNTLARYKEALRAQYAGRIAWLETFERFHRAEIAELREKLKQAKADRRILRKRNADMARLLGRKRILEILEVRSVQLGQGAQREQPVQNGRQTTAERRRAVLELLATPEGRKMPDREIARRIGVSPTTVGNLRKRRRG